MKNALATVLKLSTLVTGIALFLAGCATGAVPVDTTYTATAQDSRIQFIVLHFTSTGFAESLETLTGDGVSAHYLVRDEPPIVYRLVDDSQRAWHAGESSWEGNTQLNSASIGIEIVNRGNRDGAWQPYPPRQVDTVVALVGELVRKYHVRPDHVVGHSDVAPLRKVDPGPLFPWKRLADAGLSEWPDEALVAGKRAAYEATRPDAEWFQQRLGCVGYSVERTGAFDEQTRRVLSAFQMHFRPVDFSGTPDAETAAILDALVTTRPGDAPWCTP